MLSDDVDFTNPWTGELTTSISGVTSVEFHCDVCRKTFKTDETFRTHLESGKHKKAESESSRKSLSPSKKSPNVDALKQAERQAQRLEQSGQCSRAAQVLYDTGMEHARCGRVKETSRLLLRCLSLLPPLEQDASVSRVMIEVKSRLVLARSCWRHSLQDATSHVASAARLFHAREEIIPGTNHSVTSHVFLCSAQWRNALLQWSQEMRHRDVLFVAHFTPMAREMGRRICSSPNVSSSLLVLAAALLWIAEDFVSASAALRAARLAGPLHQCLLEGRLWRPLLLSAAVEHPDPVMLQEVAERSEKEGWINGMRLARAVQHWDYCVLESISSDTSCSDEDRKLAKALCSALAATETEP